MLGGQRRARGVGGGGDDSGGGCVCVGDCEDDAVVKSLCVFKRSLTEALYLGISSSHETWCWRSMIKCNKRSIQITVGLDETLNLHHWTAGKRIFNY